MDISLFEDDWKECLRAHYDYVVREHDDNNEGSLISVLVQTGFTQDEIDMMRAEKVASLDEDFDAVAEVEAEPIEYIEAPVEVAEPAIVDSAGGELFEPPVVPEVSETLEASQTLETPAVMEILEEEEQSDSDDEPPEAESFTQMALF